MNSDHAPDACRTNCQPHSCGDGVIDFDEDCEGDTPGIHSCQTLGYAGGTLVCEACRFNTEACEGGPGCGDGIRELPYEQCDDGNQVGGDGCAHNCHLERGGACGSMIDLTRLWDERPAGQPYLLVKGSTNGKGDTLAGEDCEQSYLSGEDLTYALWVGKDAKVLVKLFDTSSPVARHALLIRKNCADPATQIVCEQFIRRFENLGMEAEVLVDANTQIYLTVDTELQRGGDFEFTLTILDR